MLSLGSATLRRWCKCYDETGNCLILKLLKEGRHSLFNARQAILNYLQEHTDADGIELRNKLAPHVSQNCFSSTLYQCKPVS